MKKLLIIIPFIFCAVASFAYEKRDTFPNNQGTSNASTLFHYHGGLVSDKGFVNTRFPDTLTANLNYIKGVAGGQIIVGDTVYIRNIDTTAWITIGRFSNLGGDTLFAQRPLFFDSVTRAPNTIIKFAQANGVIGGVVTLDSCRNMSVSPGIVTIDFTDYYFIFTQLTIPAADPSNPRTDIVVVDTLGNVSIITGTPAVTPLPPSFNPSSQFVLAQYTIGTAATCLGITQEIIYDQNTGSPEWTPTTSGSGSTNFSNTDKPYHLTRAAFTPTYTNGYQLIFTKPSGMDTVQATEILKAFVYFNGVFSNQIQAQWFNGSTAISNSIVLNQYLNVNDSNQYQMLAVPFSAWTYSSSIFNKLVFTFAGNDLSGAKGLYLDWIQIQAGIANFSNGKGVLNFTKNATRDSMILTLQDGTVFTVKDSTGTAGGSGTVTNVTATSPISITGVSTVTPNVVLGTVPIANGGTNITTYTTGDLLYASAPTVLSKLAIGTVSQTLHIVGGVPVWRDTAVATIDSAIWKNNGTYTGNRTLTQSGYSQTFSGGKVAFDSTTTGTDYTRVGVLLNENFSGGSIPSGWTQGLATVSYAGAKATITGAAAIGSPTGSLTAAFTSGLQYDTRRMPYEKVDFQMSVVPTTKSAGAVVGVAFAGIGNTIYALSGIFWNLSNDPNLSGRTALVTSGNAALVLPTFTTNADSTSKANFSIGDSLILYFKRNGWSVVAGIINKTTGQTTVTYFNQRWANSAGRWNLCFLNGTYVMTNAKVNILDKKGGVYFISDSQDGYGNSQESRRYADLLFQSNHKYYSVWALPSMSGKYFGDGGLPAEMIADATPSQVIEAFGYNDETEASTAPNTKIYIDSIVYPLQRAGITVGVMGIVPRNNATDIWNDSISSLATSRGCDFYNIRTPLSIAAGSLNSAYNFDGVHINDSGSIVVANVVRAKSGDTLFTVAAPDTLYQQKIFGLPNSKTYTTAGLIGINSNGSIVNIQNTLPTEAAWVKNNWSSGQGTGTVQANSSVAVSGYVRSDTGLIARGVQGGHIGFFDGNSSNTTGANLQMINLSNGAGDTQAWENITGSGNFFQVSSSANKVKAAASTISGNDNTVINSNASTTLSGSDNIKIGNYINTTSGSNNIFLGAYAGKLNQTGSNNIHLASTTTGAGYSVSNVSNTIIIGETWTYDPRGYVSGDVSISPFYATATPTFWFGGITNTGPTTWNFPGVNSAPTNGPGSGGYIRSSRGTGVAQSGTLYFQTWDNTTTGSTYHSTANSKMMIDFTGIAIGSTTVTTKVADAVVDIQSTTQGFLPPRVTTAQRDLIVNGLQSLAVSAGGSGYTNGNVSLSFSGGAGSGAAGYCVISGGSVQSVVLTARGSGYTSAPTASVTSGGGSGATFTVTYGGTTGNTVFCTDCTATDTSTGVMQTWNGTVWKNNW